MAELLMTLSGLIRGASVAEVPEVPGASAAVMERLPAIVEVDVALGVGGGEVVRRVTACCSRSC